MKKMAQRLSGKAKRAALTAAKLVMPIKKEEAKEREKKKKKNKEKEEERAGGFFLSRLLKCFTGENCKESIPDASGSPAKVRVTQHDAFVQQFTTLMAKMQVLTEKDAEGNKKFVVTFADDVKPKKSMPDIAKNVQAAGLIKKPVVLTSKHIKLGDYLPKQYAAFAAFLPADLTIDACLDNESPSANPRFDIKLGKAERELPFLTRPSADQAAKSKKSEKSKKSKKSKKESESEQ